MFKSTSESVNTLLGKDEKTLKAKQDVKSIFTKKYYDDYFKKYGNKWNKDWSKEAETITNKLWSAKGTLIDDDSQAIAYANLFRNKGQVALVNRYFRETYNKDLLTYLNFLSTESLRDFLDIVNRLKEI
jgi:hypothetical protein